MQTENNCIENIILTHSSRGIDQVKSALPKGYCSRAAKLVIENRGVILIGTGFPVNGSFETDGPLSAIGLYKVLERMGYEPVFVCAPPMSGALENKYHIYELPVLGREKSIKVVESALLKLKPSLVVSIEHPGITGDGRYYNMHGQDITELVAKYDLFFELSNCPTLAFGDGGNEIGMGNIQRELSCLPVIPSVTRCDELVIATVSNWGVYGVLAAMSCRLGQDLFRYVDPVGTTGYLLEHGFVDGVTNRSEYSEDGFPLSVGLNIIEQLRSVFSWAKEA